MKKRLQDLERRICEEESDEISTVQFWTGVMVGLAVALLMYIS